MVTSAMMFLVGQETLAQSRTSLPMPQNDASDVGEEQVVLQIEDHELEESDTDDVVIEGTDSSFVSVTSLSTPKPTKSLPPTRKRKLNKMLPESERNELLIMTKAKLSEPDDRHSARTKAWAYELSLLNAQQELFATKAINDVLFEARCGETPQRFC
ncbi:hypothetical protein ElyMa_002156100 [Elysia marginata]|uniref:BESS domain-containing protein n=1 Tax=Elysia marginata TaxID=1093978 RepID=A0AAV4FLK4_9GAST|nr:hypothetical protein ElyMa_002156100 [Elysia marginata]